MMMGYRNPALSPGTPPLPPRLDSGPGYSLMRMWMGQLAGMSQSVSRCKAYTSSWSLLGGEARVS
jgi:hypothetical protein